MSQMSQTNVPTSSSLGSQYQVAYAQHLWGDDSFNAGLKMLEEVVSFA